MYPDALAHYSYIKTTNIIYKIWSKANKKIFSKANRIFTLTDGMKSLAQKYVNTPEKVEIVPLWSDNQDFTTVSKADNLILKKTNSIGKFNIVYSGNLGLTHPIEKIVELGEFLEPEHFNIIIIGGGAKKKLVENLIQTQNFSHVHLLPWQPVAFLSHNLYAADINVVTLDKEASNISIPSKTFNILSIGNPILGICSQDSALARLINEYNCGLVSESLNIKDLAIKLKELQSNKKMLEEFKRNSIKASKNFTKQNAQAYL
jgi:glycosyltransferase involved in cell wall biosynthesis